MRVAFSSKYCLFSCRTKCIKMFDLKLDYFESSQYCNKLNARLVQLESYDELSALQRICRVSPAAPVAAEARIYSSSSITLGGGCWIGLRDVHGNNTYEWDAPSYMTNRGFRDWRRTEVLDRDDPEGFIDIDRRCVYSAPWQEDPLIAEQGSWVASPCRVPRTFVCEHAASTINRDVVVNGLASFSNGSKVNGGRWHFRNSTVFNSLVGTKSAELIIDSMRGSPRSHRVTFIRLERGSVLDVLGGQSLLSEGPAFVGESRAEAGGGSYWMQPMVRVAPTSNWTFRPDNTRLGATIEARVVDIRGTVVVTGNHSLTLAQVIGASKIYVKIIFQTLPF
jgi:hypothetical protein